MVSAHSPCTTGCGSVATLSFQTYKSLADASPSVDSSAQRGTHIPSDNLQVPTARVASGKCCVPQHPCMSTRMHVLQGCTPTVFRRRARRMSATIGSSMRSGRRRGCTPSAMTPATSRQAPPAAFLPCHALLGCMHEGGHGRCCGQQAASAIPNWVGMRVGWPTGFHHNLCVQEAEKYFASEKQNFLAQMYGWQNVYVGACAVMWQATGEQRCPPPHMHACINNLPPVVLGSGPLLLCEQQCHGCAMSSESQNVVHEEGPVE